MWFNSESTIMGCGQEGRAHVVGEGCKVPFGRAQGRMWGGCRGKFKALFIGCKVGYHIFGYQNWNSKTPKGKVDYW